MNKKVIVPVNITTDWCSPAFFVPKADMVRVQLVTDYTHLNKYVKSLSPTPFIFPAQKSEHLIVYWHFLVPFAVSFFVIIFFAPLSKQKHCSMLQGTTCIRRKNKK